jgi:hypothetical protein
MLAILAVEYTDLNRTMPMTATGILFNDPTRPYVVGVVVDRNQSVEYEILKLTMQERPATVWKEGDVKEASVASLCGSPNTTTRMQTNGNDSKLL